MSISPFAPIALNGLSKYSSDFQSVLDRALRIAQIPITALQNKDSDLLQQKTLLSTLRVSIGSLADSLTSLGNLAANKALAATSSNTAAVTVSDTGATAPGTYTINSVTSAATFASERSLNSYADSSSTPVSSKGNMDLVVGGVDHNFSLSTNTLVGLRDQINSLGAGVTASILTTPNGNYLSVAANATGAAPIQLIDDPAPGANTNLLTGTNPGTDAVFKLNGIDITQHGNVVNNIIPGATFNIVSASNTPVTLSLTTDRSQLSSALQDLVAKYNDTQGLVRAQIGPGAGLLSGDTVIGQLSDTLRQITTYSATSGSVRTLADLGVTFDNSGKLNFDRNALNSLSDTQIADAVTFLGSATSGLGGFSATLSGFSDPIFGLIKTEQNGIDRMDQNLQDQIATLSDRLNAMQNNLAAQLNAADAAAALLQSQQQTLTATLQGLNLVLYGRNQNQLG